MLLKGEVPGVPAPDVVAGGAFRRYESPRKPAVVRVVFPRCDGVTAKSDGLRIFTVDLSSKDAEAVPGRIKTFYSTACAATATAPRRRGTKTICGIWPGRSAAITTGGTTAGVTSTVSPGRKAGRGAAMTTPWCGGTARNGRAGNMRRTLASRRCRPMSKSPNNSSNFPRRRPRPRRLARPRRRRPSRLRGDVPVGVKWIGTPKWTLAANNCAEPTTSTSSTVAQYHGGPDDHDAQPLLQLRRGVVRRIARRPRPRLRPYRRRPRRAATTRRRSAARSTGNARGPTALAISRRRRIAHYVHHLDEPRPLHLDDARPDDDDGLAAGLHLLQVGVDPVGRRLRLEAAGEQLLGHAAVFLPAAGQPRSRVRRNHGRLQGLDDDHESNPTSCEGKCYWVDYPTWGKWFLAKFGCVSVGVSDCNCEAPSDTPTGDAACHGGNGLPGAVAADDDGPALRPLHDDHDDDFHDGGPDVLLVGVQVALVRLAVVAVTNPCPATCPCQPPPFDGESTCEVAFTPCSGGSTTTTAAPSTTAAPTTSTTSTTPVPCSSKTCSFVCSESSGGLYWAMQTHSCWGPPVGEPNCGCCPLDLPTCGGARSPPLGSTYTKGCGTGPCVPTTTTTTAAPCSGSCTWQCLPDGGSGWQWQITGSLNCPTGSGCGCVAPVGPCD